MRLDQLCVASEAETAVILPHVVSLCRCRKSIQRFKLLMQWDEKKQIKVTYGANRRSTTPVCLRLNG